MQCLSYQEVADVCFVEGTFKLVRWETNRTTAIFKEPQLLTPTPMWLVHFCLTTKQHGSHQNPDVSQNHTAALPQGSRGVMLLTSQTSHKTPRGAFRPQKKSFAKCRQINKYVRRRSTATGLGQLKRHPQNDPLNGAKRESPEHVHFQGSGWYTAKVSRGKQQNSPPSFCRCLGPGDTS